MRISDWSSDVCSSDLTHRIIALGGRMGERAGAVMRRKAHFQTSFKTGSGGGCEHGGAGEDRAFETIGDAAGDRKSGVEGKRVSGRVERGGRRLIKKKNTKN